MKKLELLSPVANLESLKIAIANGADAVYLGLDEFNARGNEENFNNESLAEALIYAHLFGVKVYLALNILIQDKEFEFAIDIARKSLKMGVDAFIIQDIALAREIKKRFPNAVLHASTQMGCSNLEGAQFLKEQGFSRIVLARETSLKEIKRIKENLDIELEYFVHGALCVSYSGNCYLCSLLAGASGNRGKCKQFCRLPYELNKTKQGYLLSSKDICMLSKLDELASAGIMSFKIEGRARRSAYIGRATKVYRDAIDNGFKFEYEDMVELKKVFNRGGFVEGYLSGEKIIYDKAQSHIGIEIGHVVKVNKGNRFNEIIVASNHEFTKGDVVKFFNNGAEQNVMSIQDVRKLEKGVYRLTSKQTPCKNDKINLIVDFSADAQLQVERKIPVNAKLTAKKGKCAILTLSCRESSVTIESEFICEEAKNMGASEESVKESISKLSPPFELGQMQCEIENVFIVKSKLNSLRRLACEKLKEKILKDYISSQGLQFEERACEEKVVHENVKPLKILASSTEEVISSNNNFDGYIFMPYEYDVQKICQFVDNNQSKKIYLFTPVMATVEEIELLRDILKKCDNLGVYANNYYALNLTAHEKTIVGAGLNVFNSNAVKFYAELGFKMIVISIEEFNFDHISNFGTNLLYFSSYYPEFMNFAHCPVKEHVGGNCGNCKFGEMMTYRLNNNEFSLIRRKLTACHFALKSKKLFSRYIENMGEIVEIENEGN